MWGTKTRSKQHRLSVFSGLAPEGAMRTWPLTGLGFLERECRWCGDHRLAGGLEANGWSPGVAPDRLRDRVYLVGISRRKRPAVGPEHHVHHPNMRARITTMGSTSPRWARSLVDNSKRGLEPAKRACCPQWRVVDSPAGTWTTTFRPTRISPGPGGGLSCAG